MASPALSHFLPRFGVATAVAGVLSLAGCQTWNTQDTLPPTSGVQPLKGLAQNVSVRRNAMGMPLIESNTFHDALFSLGYVHASDRINQMVTLRLLAQGRLAEMSGPSMLDADRYMRAVNLKKSAGELYKASSPRLKRFFEVYARGVNAYLFRYADKLPGDLAASGYKPEYWKPEDSALIFALLNFSQSANLPEEISSLVLAQSVTTDRLAWLTPSAPDENLQQAEADKLQGLKLNGQIPGLTELSNASQQLSAMNLLGAASSNNWAIAPQRSRSGKSLLASDSHGPLAAPSLWSFVQIRAPKYQAAGVTVAGLPMVLGGFNGKVAWSMTSVLGDNQDLFLEKNPPSGQQPHL
jgi:acyl-homoserine-lactone acylase